MIPETLLNFAKELKANREQTNVTLQQIQNRTKIDLRFLQAIEEGNYNIMPEVYIRAFIKEYAKAVGLDSELIINKYNLAKEGKTSEVEKTILEDGSASQQEIKRKFDASELTNAETDKTEKENTNLIVIIASAVVVVLLAVYFIFFNGSSTEIISETPYEEVLQESEQRYQVADDTNSDEIVESESIIIDSLTLRINAIDTCWVGVTVDKNLATDFIMYPKRSKILKAVSDFEIVVGNAGGVKFFLNNNDLNYEGMPGRRDRIIIDTSGIKK
ncbi:MAG: DUF4115 domain-containing protein [Melioribacteraceae bacterium]|nr:DUF4115 domain-containing protein [Melioribacteraceae bacterium]